MTLVAVLALLEGLLLATPTSTLAAFASTNPTNPIGTYSVIVTCGCGTFTHTLTITAYDPTHGGLYGTNTNPQGTVTGIFIEATASVSMQWAYQDGSGYVASFTGTIDTSRNMSGTGTDNQNQSWTWTGRPTTIHPGDVTSSHHLSVSCGAAVGAGQQCGSIQSQTVVTTGDLALEYVNDNNGGCGPGRVHFYLDGADVAQRESGPGQPDTGLVDLSPVAGGSHRVGMSMFGEGTGCPFVNYNGTFSVTVSVLGSTCARGTSTSCRRTPDIKVTLHVARFDIGVCAGSIGALIGNDAKALTACGLLFASANSDPPSDFTASSWIEFEQSREYRGYVHIPATEVLCNNSRVVAVNGQTVRGPAPLSDAGFEHSLGFTPTPPFGFDPAERYAGIFSRLIDEETPELAPTAGGAVLISYTQAARLGAAERRAQYELTGYDAPYVWVAVQEVVSCGATTVDVLASSFPSSRLYVNDQLVDSFTQDAALGHFLSVGGTTFHQNLDGNLYDACAALSTKAHSATNPIRLTLPGNDCKYSLILANRIAIFRQ